MTESVVALGNSNTNQILVSTRHGILYKLDKSVLELESYGLYIYVSHYMLIKKYK